MILIGIGGPSTSGKTTICKYLAKRYKTFYIEGDNYFKNKENIPTKGRWRNWELPKNIKFDLLFENLSDLKKGISTKLPIYSFENGKFIKFKSVKPKEIIFVESFNLFYNKKVRDLIDIKIYLDISMEEILKRKKNRKEYYHSRQSKNKWTEKQYFEEIFVPTFKKYGKIQKKYANFVIDSKLSIKDMEEKIVNNIEKNIKREIKKL